MHHVCFTKHSWYHDPVCHLFLIALISEWLFMFIYLFIWKRRVKTVPPGGVVVLSSVSLRPNPPKRIPRLVIYFRVNPSLPPPQWFWCDCCSKTGAVCIFETRNSCFTIWGVQFEVIEWKLDSLPFARDTDVTCQRGRYAPFFCVHPALFNIPSTLQGQV